MISEIFENPSYRNLFLEVCSFLTYAELKKLSLVEKIVNENLKRLISNNYFVFDPIFVQRFNERSECRFFDMEDTDFYKVILHKGSKFPIEMDNVKSWKNKIPEIDIGDIIYIQRRNEYVLIKSNVPNYRFLVSSTRTSKEPVFPINYWNKISEKAPFRVWIPCRCKGREDIEFWRKNSTNVFMTPIQPDNFLITYSEKKIYFYSREECILNTPTNPIQ